MHPCCNPHSHRCGAAHLDYKTLLKQKQKIKNAGGASKKQYKKEKRWHPPSDWIRPCRGWRAFHQHDSEHFSAPVVVAQTLHNIPGVLNAVDRSPHSPRGRLAAVFKIRKFSENRKFHPPTHSLCTLWCDGNLNFNCARPNAYIPWFVFPIFFVFILFVWFDNELTY